MCSTVLFAFLVCSIGQLALSAQVVDQVAHESTKVLNAGRDGHMIRQCSCPEQSACVEQMKKQAIQCFHTCWGTAKLDTITNNPAQLKTCFESKEYIIDDFLGCLGEDTQTCVADKNGPQVPYTDINKVISAGEKKLTTQANKFMASLNKDGHELLQTALTVGSCIKNCFVQENASGFCFDKTGCQPKIGAHDAKTTIKKCAKDIGWKKEAGELCDCATNAGVEKVKQYCQLLHSVDHNRSGHRSRV